MFRELIEAIRLEGAARGAIDKWSKPGEGVKLAKKSVTRYLRQKTKLELKKKAPDEVNIPRRGTSGYES
jgi:hypothetical protein